MWVSKRVQVAPVYSMKCNGDGDGDDDDGGGGSGGGQGFCYMAWWYIVDKFCPTSSNRERERRAEKGQSGGGGVWEITRLHPTLYVVGESSRPLPRAVENHIVPTDNKKELLVRVRDCTVRADDLGSRRGMLNKPPPLSPPIAGPAVGWWLHQDTSIGGEPPIHLPTSEDGLSV